MPLFDLSARAKLRLTGSDRVRFLNGQVTNDVRKAGPDLALPACVLSAKGKIDAYVFISAGPDDLRIDAEAEAREPLAQRLDRYIIADDVTVEDVTEQFSLFHRTGEDRPPLPNDVSWRRAKRFGTAGWDLLVPATEHEQMRQALAAHDTFCDPEETERWRIEQGIPRWGQELTDQIIPVEANLTEEAVDYAKGCYIGQEVISRMKMSGQTNKRLCGLRALDERPLATTMRLFAEEKDVGWITSATRSESLGKEIALGYVKRGFNQPGTQLSGRDPSSAEAVRVEVVELPFG